MDEPLDFRPLPFLRSGSQQTIAGSLGLPLKDPPSEKVIVDLGDGDSIYYKVSTPEEWRSEKGIVILIHGMAGSDRSHYMVRMSRKLYRNGVRVVRMNMRGCGEIVGLAQKPHYAGASHDLLAIVEKVHQEYPQAHIKIVGYSLGGCVLLKLLGELGEEARSYQIEKAIAICPAVDLEDTANNLAKPEMRLYERFYTSALLDLVKLTEEAFPELEKANLPKDISLYGFDDRFTAIRWGFKSAKEYYATCSPFNFTSTIKIPCEILYSKDDPIINHETIDRLTVSENVKRRRLDHGGHMGFLGIVDFTNGIRWLDKAILELLQ